MPITRPIPRAASAVVKKIRQDVKRPFLNCLHRDPFGRKSSIRFSKDGYGWPCCPMGLHPDAKSYVPFSRGSFPAEVGAIRSFGIWWDNQTDARAAIAAVWPRKK